MQMKNISIFGVAGFLGLALVLTFVNPGRLKATSVTVCVTNQTKTSYHIQYQPQLNHVQGDEICLQDQKNLSPAPNPTPITGPFREDCFPIKIDDACEYMYVIVWAKIKGNDNHKAGEINIQKGQTKRCSLTGTAPNNYTCTWN